MRKIAIPAAEIVDRDLRTGSFYFRNKGIQNVLIFEFIRFQQLKADAAGQRGLVQRFANKRADCIVGNIGSGNVEGKTFLARRELMKSFAIENMLNSNFKG